MTHIGVLSVGRFMREYWQRKPLLVRGAFPGFRAPAHRRRLFQLAAREDVESRLVVRRGRRWSMHPGPIGQRSLPPLTQRGWTLLVQGLDLVDARAHELLARFRFIPDARLDDLMASYATAGGGVGPHVDNYDVFLLQAQGRRRWRISRQRDLPPRPGQPLKLLAGFKPTQEWLLEPGDMLYLPPGVAHEGIAEGECITCSIGFRAPTWAELHDPWLAAFAGRASLRGRYRDPGQRASERPAELPAAMVSQAHAALGRERPTRADTERFLLEYLTDPKHQVVFERPRRPPPLSAFTRAARRRGLVLDLRSRMLIGRAGIGINGEFVSPTPVLHPGLRRLANQRFLAPATLARAPASLFALLHEWLRAGWLCVGSGP